MANNKFIAAVKKAKSLYKSGRYKKFSDAVKAAYRKGTKKKRRRVASVTPKKRIGSHRRKRVKRNRVARVSGVKSQRRSLENSLGRAMVEHYKTQSIKRTSELGRTITKLKKKIKSL